MDNEPNEQSQDKPTIGDTLKKEFKRNHTVDDNPLTPEEGLVEPTLNDILTRVITFSNAPFTTLDATFTPYLDANGQLPQFGEKYGTSVLTATDHTIRGGSFSSAMAREDSDWRQKVEHEGTKIGPSRPRFGNSPDGVLTGDHAIHRINDVMGLGSMVTIPLWHTGIWVTIKAPSESQLLELERRCNAEKTMLARRTSGMLYSNNGIYIINYLMSFILNHVHDSSLENTTRENLKRVIKITDIQTLAWGMACAIYPKGYDYARPCTANPRQCTHITRGKVNLGKMFFTDTAAVTEHQRKMMTRRNDKFSSEEIRIYQDDHRRGGDRTVEVDDGIRAVLKVPTLEEYFNSGFKWVDGIYRMLEGALGVSLKQNEREAYVKEQAKLTALQQYSHWVREIQIEEDTVIKDRDTLDRVVGTLTGSDTIYTNFLKEIGQYIDDSTLSVIALPRTECPACGKTQRGDVHDDFHPHLLPVNAVNAFFTLLFLKTQGSISRDTTVD